MRELVGPGRTASLPVSGARTPRKRAVPLVPIAVGVVIAAAVMCASALGTDQEPTDTPDPVTRIDGGTFTRWLFPELADPVPIDDGVFVLEVHGCTGGNGTVEVWTHRFVESFFYHGQADVYLGAIHHWTYLDGELTAEWWLWFGNVTADYRAGLWEPQDGVEFRHSENQTFGAAVLSVLGATTTPIPEFSSVLIPVVVGMMIMLLIRRRIK